TFCSEQDVYNLPAIERYIEMSIPATVAYPEQMEEDKSAGMYIKTENWRGDDDYDNRGGYRKGKDGDIHNRRTGDRGDGKYSKNSDYKKSGDYKKDGYKSGDYKKGKKGGKNHDGYEKRERKNYSASYIDPAKLAGLSYEERMKLYKETYASTGSKGDYKKDDFKKKPYDKKSGGKGKYENKDKNGSYKKGDYKKGDYKKKSYQKGSTDARAAQKASEPKMTFWQKVKAFFGR
nr:hypothetical protein [Treponema sp.]